MYLLLHLLILLLLNVHRVPIAQLAAAARPVDLGKRQRRKVVYNEVELGRAKASDGSSSSSSGSEFEADDAADDEDEDGSGDGSGSGLVEEGADGKRVRAHSLFLLCFLLLSVIKY